MNKGNMVIWFLIVVVVVVALIFFSGKKGDNYSPKNEVGDVSQNTNMENTKQLEGVKVTILKEGNGVEAKVGDTVSMNYTGTLLDGTVFDSNVLPKFGHVEPFEFTLGQNNVIQGWEIGVLGMKVGEKRKLEIKSDYAYGARGAGASIPPNADLNFEVELLVIKK